MSQERESSLERFRRLTEDMKRDIHVTAVNELNKQAEILKDAIASVTPVYQGPPLPDAEPGALKITVNVRPDRSKDTVVRIVAGGALTTPRGRTHPFDYARAVEFGTYEMEAEPFFFPTYRLMKKRMIAGMKRRIATQIKKYSAEQSAASDV